ncbi:MAG: hypothetical protein II363_05485 [Clostridia bacterium]|nr:hypothetical protein [Loktanella sp.]MBQ1951024.1 hypothetical protein [Clostridia bacterium]
MSEFLRHVGSELTDLFSFFVTIALLQNIVLTTGFGASLVLLIVRKPKNIWLFSGIMTAFSVLMVLIAYPLDMYFGTAITNLWRPLMMIGILVILYIPATLIIRRWWPSFYTRISRLLPMAAFNSLTVGIALVTNVQFSSNLGGNIGLTFGACLAFGVITWLVAEGIERLDNPDMPAAFRGMPATLLYIGILALALLGFTSNFSLI